MEIPPLNILLATQHCCSPFPLVVDIWTDVNLATRWTFSSKPREFVARSFAPTSEWKLVYTWAARQFENWDICIKNLHQFAVNVGVDLVEITTNKWGDWEQIGRVDGAFPYLLKVNATGCGGSPFFPRWMRGRGN